MDTTAFYEAVSGVAFTLLGLWWTALSFAQGGWRDDPHRRRLVLHVALNLMLLGAMGLTSLVSGPIDDGIIWRLAFITSGVIGFREGAGWLKGLRGSSDTVSWLAALAAPLFALTIVAALMPANSVIDPRQIEALVVTANLLRALCVVWQVLAGWSAPPVDPSGRR